MELVPIEGKGLEAGEDSKQRACLQGPVWE